MTRHEPGLHRHRPNPGGAVVADLRAMESAQALSVILFRDWFDGEAGRARVAGLLTRAMGSERAAQGVAAWGDLIHCLCAEARRPIMRRALACPCVGADEAVIAQVLTLSAMGEREDATCMLALLIPGDRVLIAARAAEIAGQAVLALARHDDTRAAPEPARRLH